MFSEMKSGFDELVEYVMDMLADKLDDEVELLEKAKDSYADIIDLKKESLRVTKEENKYQKTVEEKLKKMAKLQEQINALSLDDSRDAQAQKAKLIEQLAELQDDLNETQADRAYDIQVDSLDKMQDAYETEKDAEIKAMEDAMKSYEARYQQALEYIDANYETVIDELITWNEKCGDSLNSEIYAAWQKCTEAVTEYGNAVKAAIELNGYLENGTAYQQWLQMQKEKNGGSEDGIPRIVSDTGKSVHFVEQGGSSPANAKEGDFVVTGGGVYQIDKDGNGVYVGSLRGLAQVGESGTTSDPTEIGKAYDKVYGYSELYAEDEVRAIISANDKNLVKIVQMMYDNSKAWKETSSQTERDTLARDSELKANILKRSFGLDV